MTKCPDFGKHGHQSTRDLLALQPGLPRRLSLKIEIRRRIAPPCFDLRLILFYLTLVKNFITHCGSSFIFDFTGKGQEFPYMLILQFQQFYLLSQCFHIVKLGTV